MKVRKLKTRIAAFGLAVLMGVSTLSSANAFAAEQTGSEQQTEVQASEQAVTSQKDTSVTADDITKAVSDETFAVETSMEGIHYDAEKEEVTLVSIKDENGGEYHSDKAGTYIATYMVIPKDKSDSYTITRKVTLTDTEGQAHSEENGGEKQKSDTESEDDSESPVQNYTDVEIETSEEDASAQAVKELKEDIEEGNVMVLSAAERATSSGSTVTLTKGRTIYYPTDAKGTLTFDSDLPHGKYYVKEEVRKAGYLPNEEVWNVDATYENQNLAKIELNKEIENQPTETRITKTDATTGNELEGAKLQVIDKDGTVVEEWISTKEEHVIYGLPEGSYTLHEELAPYEDGYVSASDVTFEVKEDGSVTKVEMKDEYSKVEISKTDLTTGKELEGAKLQIIRKDGTVLEEWITDGKPHSVAKLSVNEELTLREITAPDGYEIAEDVTFTLKDTMEVQKVEMKDARTPEKTTEKTNAPKTGDNQKVWAFILLGLASAGTVAGVTVYRRKKSKMTENKEETEEK